MLHSTLTETAGKLEAFLGEKNLHQIGADSGFTQRSRSITAPRLVPCLLQCMGGGKVEGIADLLRAFNLTYGTSVFYKPFYERLDRPEFVTLMRAVLIELMKHLRQKMLYAAKGGPFEQFKDILIQDGSSLGLRDGLAKIFPGRFNTKSPAAVAVHLIMSLYHDNIAGVAISPQAHCEQHYLPDPELLAGKLILLDRGYDNTQYMRKVDDAGGSFLVRMRSLHDPIVEKIYRSGKRFRKLEGHHLSYVLAKIPKDRAVDLNVSIAHKKVVLPASFRMVCSWNTRTKSWMRLMTNMNRDTISVGDVLQAYHLRWQVELIFKEFKSYTNLHKFQTNKPFIAEGLILASLCAALLRRYIAACCQAATYQPISTRRMAMCQSLIGQICASLSQGFSATVEALQEIFGFLRSNCQRANLEREHARGRCAVGVVPWAHTA